MSGEDPLEDLFRSTGPFGTSDVGDKTGSSIRTRGRDDPDESVT